MNNSYLAKQISATRECDGELSEGLVFALPDRLEVLADRGMLTLMDATHDSNKLKWLCETSMEASYQPRTSSPRRRTAISWLWRCVKFVDIAKIDGLQNGY